MSAGCTAPHHPVDVDPFDLPEWLGEGAVTWTAEAGVREGHRVPGRLTGEGGADLPCDLLAVDAAYPAPVADEATRTAAHRAWHHGQVHLAEVGERLTLLVPGRGFAADDVLEAVARLARAVGSDPDRYAVLLRIGAPGRRRGGDGR
ncbi:hypothetical protein [Nocardioides perillae]|uniref:Uncharacterized protein n=1 Tax=Nocardioides perillae TaxID=1119534 RepID=A0A7Y9UMY1_9ACTN|nr:hypothetical protein [Nocardioides perillae]NYG55871.1 hypothetical protein [Nocardioides perillae]